MSKITVRFLNKNYIFLKSTKLTPTALTMVLHLMFYNFFYAEHIIKSMELFVRQNKTCSKNNILSDIVTKKSTCVYKISI